MLASWAILAPGAARLPPISMAALPVHFSWRARSAQVRGSRIEVEERPTASSRQAAIAFPRIAPCLAICLAPLNALRSCGTIDAKVPWSSAALTFRSAAMSRRFRTRERTSPIVRWHTRHRLIRGEPRAASRLCRWLGTRRRRRCRPPLDRGTLVSCSE